jgi:hypothetical protein
MTARTARLVLISITIVSVILLLTWAFLLRDAEEHASPDRIRKRIESLRTVPYTSLTADSVGEAGSGVVLHDSIRAYEGYNLYGSGRSGVAVLMDMYGQIVHKWMYPREGTPHWFVVALLPSGDIIVIEDYRGLLRLDWASNLVWEKRMRAHHDIALSQDSTFRVLSANVKMHRGLQVKFPSIVRLTWDGDVLDTWSAYDNLDHIKERCDPRYFLDTMLDSVLALGLSLSDFASASTRLQRDRGRGAMPVYEYFHANAVNILPDNPLVRQDPRFQAGNLLTCLRNVNQIAILDEDSKGIVWVWGEDELQWPHHPTMTPEGNILVFDNGVERGYSRIVEVNPITKEIEWQYIGDPPERFFNATKGSAQRLPNGNTLITDSERGRVFEVTRSGEIVWEWLNPETRKGRRLQIYRMTRLAPDVIEPLLEN